MFGENKMPLSSDERKTSLKKQTVHLLDQFLLGYISAKDLINAAVPMLMVSQNRRGRKNYIEKYLVELAGKPETELTRDYIYKIRETIKGEVVTSEKDRSKVFRRTLRKLIERYLYDEIEEPYYLSMLSDMMVDFYDQIQTEPDVKRYFDLIQKMFTEKKTHSETPTEEPLAGIKASTLDFYDHYFKGLWDE